MLPLLKRHHTRVLPVDSEHSAIFQCLQGAPPDSLRRLILTASGGAFRALPASRLASVTVKDALNHPNWSMGAKITIDSATLMNKGFEVLEAHFLFGVDYDAIDVLVHPQSIIHSLVEFKDSSVVAQLGRPDMRLPILYALSWPRRLETSYPSLDLAKVASLTFEQPDLEKYPCLGLAYEAGRAGGVTPAVLNAANEVAVQMFRGGEIDFLDIPRVLRFALDSSEPHTCSPEEELTIEDIVEADRWGRERSRNFLKASRSSAA
eukprot:GHVU01122702.1.p1 GENE.GHVU01122702.1~~GHVU01122702.1.p1  ORF type:complete len:263 (+),score=53.28 GHVU01122702.1:1284-2072(+)